MRKRGSKKKKIHRLKDAWRVGVLNWWKLSIILYRGKKTVTSICAHEWVRAWKTVLQMSFTPESWTILWEDAISSASLGILNNWKLSIFLNGGKTVKSICAHEWVRAWKTVFHISFNPKRWNILWEDAPSSASLVVWLLERSLLQIIAFNFYWIHRKVANVTLCGKKSIFIYIYWKEMYMSYFLSANFHIQQKVLGMCWVCFELRYSI